LDQVVLIKVVSALLYPTGLLSVLWVSYWIFRAFSWSGLSRLCAVGGFAVFLFASNPKIASWLAVGLEQQYPQRALDKIYPADAIIVLGGGLRIPTQPALHAQLGSAGDRYWYAAQLYKAGKGKKILLTGGNVYAQEGLASEAFYAKQLLQDWGVPEHIIVVETNSRTTRQNMQGVATMIDQEKIQSALLVTSALHMPRAYKLFAKLPIAIEPASADVLIREQTKPEVFNWIPSARALNLSTISLHEYYGAWFDLLQKD